MSKRDVTTAGSTPSRITLQNVLFAAVGEVAIAVLLIDYAHGVRLGTLFESLVLTWAGAALGVLSGAAMAALQLALIARWQRWRGFLREAVGRTDFGVGQIVAIGLIVGIAEELLFRAAVQPLLGIVPTSLLFAAIHWNYAALRGGRAKLLLSLLAFATIFAISVVLGLLYEAHGLVAAMVAHAVYDIIVLLGYRRLLVAAHGDTHATS